MQSTPEEAHIQLKESSKLYLNMTVLLVQKGFQNLIRNKYIKSPYECLGGVLKLLEVMQEIIDDEDAQEIMLIHTMGLRELFQRHKIQPNTFSPRGRALNLTDQISNDPRNPTFNLTDLKTSQTIYMDKISPPRSQQDSGQNTMSVRSLENMDPTNKTWNELQKILKNSVDASESNESIDMKPIHEIMDAIPDVHLSPLNEIEADTYEVSVDEIETDDENGGFEDRVYPQWTRPEELEKAVINSGNFFGRPTRVKLGEMFPNMDQSRIERLNEEENIMLESFEGD